MIYPPWIVSTEGPNHELFTWLELLSPGTACVLMALLYTGQMLDVDVAAQMDSNRGHQFSHYSAVSSVTWLMLHWLGPIHLVHRQWRHRRIHYIHANCSASPGEHISFASLVLQPGRQHISSQIAWQPLWWQPSCRLHWLRWSLVGETLQVQVPLGWFWWWWRQQH